MGRTSWRRSGFARKHRLLSADRAREAVDENARAGGWRGRHAMLCAAVLLAPIVVGVSLEEDRIERLLTASALVWMTREFASLLASAVLYYVWRAGHQKSVGWLCAAFVAFAVYNAPFAMVAVGSPELRAGRALAGVPALVLGVLLAVLVGFAVRGTRLRWRLRPLQVGLAVGVGTGALGYLSVSDHAPWKAVLVPGEGALLATLGLVLGLVLSVMIGFVRSLPDWTRRRLVLVALGITFSVTVSRHGVDESWQALLSLSLDLGAAVLLTCVSLRLGVHTVTEQHRDLTTMEVRASEAEAAARAREETLHEVRATIAGIATASRLLRQQAGELAAHDAARLEHMVGAEIERAQRLVVPSARSPVQVVELDQVLGPVVECQRATGQDVRWQPSRLRAFGCPDGIAQALHTLLINAQVHAPGAVVEITAGNRGTSVELRVTDDGPGVVAEVAEHLFERGSRGRASRGQGIGLYVAQRMLSEHGGTIVLDEPDRVPGASFVVRLPAAAGRAAPRTNGSARVPRPR
jgi:signal transduction histidine kinase